LAHPPSSEIRRDRNAPRIATAHAANALRTATKIRIHSRAGSQAAGLSAARPRIAIPASAMIV
jgi:hypothetical protein